MGSVVHADAATKDSAAVGGGAGAPGAPQPLLPGLQGPGDLLLRGRAQAPHTPPLPGVHWNQFLGLFISPQTQIQEAYPSREAMRQSTCASYATTPRCLLEPVSWADPLLFHHRQTSKKQTLREKHRRVVAYFFHHRHISKKHTHEEEHRRLSRPREWRS